MIFPILSYRSQFVNAPLPAEPEQSLAGLAFQSFLKAESPSQFEQALRLRTQVFVHEQQVPAEEEQDEYDDEARHWLLIDPSTGDAIATGRMLSYQEGCQMRPVAKIGRIAICQGHRGKGLGHALMREILKAVDAEGFDQAILDAQTSVMPFYAKLGFIAEGDEFLDAGIPHFRMRLLLQ